MNTIESLQIENTALRERIAELEAALDQIHDKLPKVVAAYDEWDRGWNAAAGHAIEVVMKAKGAS